MAIYHFSVQVIGRAAGRSAVAAAAYRSGGVIACEREGRVHDYSRKQGIEVTLKMDNGELLAVTQEDGGENFQPGERVRLLQDGGTTRVTR